MSTQQTGGAGEEARLSLYPLLGHIDAEFGTSASQCLDEGHRWAQWPCTGGGQPPMRGVGSGRPFQPNPSMAFKAHSTLGRVPSSPKVRPFLPPRGRPTPRPPKALRASPPRLQDGAGAASPQPTPPLPLRPPPLAAVHAGNGAAILRQGWRERRERRQRAGGGQAPSAALARPPPRTPRLSAASHAGKGGAGPAVVSGAAPGAAPGTRGHWGGCGGSRGRLRRSCPKSRLPCVAGH